MVRTTALPNCLAALLTVLAFQSAAWAQRATVAGGGDASGPGGSASFSIGQVVYRTFSDSEVSVAQGVQQPYEISVVTGMDEVDEGPAPVLYPNPTNGDVRLQFHNAPQGAMQLHLSDAQGRTIHNAPIRSDAQDIPLHGHASGTYLLQVIKEGTVIRTFRIVKH